MSLDPALLDELHKQYGYSDAYNLDMELFTEFEQITGLMAIARVKVCGEWISHEIEIAPFEESVSWASNTTVGWYLPVQIQETYWTAPGFTDEKNVSLYFFSEHSFSDFNAYQVGEEYVCLITDVSENAVYAGKEDNVYTCSPYGCFYIVGGETSTLRGVSGEYLLTMTEQEGLTTKYDGLSVNAFVRELEHHLP